VIQEDKPADNIKMTLDKMKMIEAANKKRQEKKDARVSEDKEKRKLNEASTETEGDFSDSPPKKDSSLVEADTVKNIAQSAEQSEEKQASTPLGGEKKEAKDIDSAKSSDKPVAEEKSKSEREVPAKPVVDDTAEAEKKAEDSVTEEAPEPESKAKQKIPELKLRLPNVRQGVRSPGLEIKRSQDTDGKKHRWEKYYVDPDADVTEEELGIDYDLGSGLLHVTPSKHGDFIIWFRREESGYPKLACRLTVIPDPKTLWTASDPPEDAPYPKEHKDSKFLKAGKRIMAGASLRGRSHARDGTHRDDDFLVCELVDGWNLMVVADGAGGSNLSRKGSQILVETMYSLISEKLSDSKTLDGLNAEASGAINDSSTIDRAKNLLVIGAYSSLMKIQEEAKSKEARTKDYNTTIISCLFKEFGEKTFVYSFCIGDGALFVVEVANKKVLSLNVADSGEFAGQTRFLTTPDVWQDHGVYERVKTATIEGPISIIGMTDGVSDPLLPDVDEIKEYAQIETLLNGLKGDDSVDGLLEVLRETVLKSDASNLEEWLDFYVAKHHDDRSIAVAFDPQFLP
jgi:hypothetical protein